ncbi:hypothetical protein PF005_g24668 [Phytophthora fragariae]|uniref:Phosphoribosyltransferase domain-containing protein n=1 Tax=Phytophthora fragariae TaxID=53985 RepID=A0A6A3W0W3_9STRA|nr:hypothetical protein PF009_g25657 [Phytophthora fragariae]KAE8977918.1 hypothetical protein PF011_g23459 [Phytophthora fragariae]KAE9076418.1 hypothetical protein PF007_g24632 [Phytophthora fragariae]KAE9095549.1 hypothetical protein PF006_g23983 [Phytophthora fragariae]KAE9177029.1 hypothetical protein PF005_g24668 [Phytophthora fragariae]
MRARTAARYEVEMEEHQEAAPARRKRSVPDDFFAETDTKRAATEPSEAAVETSDSSPFAEEKKPRKRPNYLQHDDRRVIIERVSRGEPQAALAREFGVTRAAVCQMYKKREKILARGGGSQASEPRGATAAPQPAAGRKLDVKRTPVAGRDSDPFSTMHKQSNTVKALVATLRDSRTNPAAFRRAAARLTFILIEAAISSYDVPETDITGRAASHVEFCAITLGDESASFLTAFGQVDPDAPTGQIHVKATQDNDTTSWKLHYLDVPDNITHVEVLLFSTFGNGGAESKAIEALQRIGVIESRISLVMVGCSSHGYAELSSRHPKVALIPATIDDEWSLAGWLRPHAPSRVVPISFA